MPKQKKINKQESLELNFQMCLKLSQVIPSLFQIALAENLKLNRARDYKAAVRIYKSLYWFFKHNFHIFFHTFSCLISNSGWLTSGSLNFLDPCYLYNYINGRMGILNHLYTFLINFTGILVIIIYFCIRKINWFKIK